MRATLTRGSSTRGLNFPNKTKPNLFISITKNLKPAKLYIKAHISKYKVNELSPLSQIKTLNYLENILARQEAQDKNYDEGILLNSKNAIVSAAAANIFFVTKNNEIVTPKVVDGALPGITRDVIFEICHEEKISISEATTQLDDLKNFKEAFITNSLIEIQKISKINAIEFSSGNIINKLQGLYKKYKNV